MTLEDTARGLLMGLRDPVALAEMFCALDDDAQTRFLSEVWRVMGTWDRPAAREMQCYYIAGHANTCACGEGAKELITALAENLQVSTHV